MKDKEWIAHWNDGVIVLYQLHYDHDVKDSKGRKVGHYARLCRIGGTWHQYIHITRNGETFGADQKQYDLRIKDLEHAKELTNNKLNELNLKVMKKFT